MEQESLTERLEEGLSVFDEAGKPWTTPEVADCLDLGRRTAYNRLEQLVEHDHLETKKVGAGARVWWRPQTPAEESGDGDTETGQSGQATRWEQQFRSLVEATEEYAIFMLDSDGYVQTWNPGAARIKGYDADDILGRHFSTFYTEDDRARGVPEKNLEAAADAGSIQDKGWRLRDDGSHFWANVTITAIRDDDGELIGYAKVTRDMSDHKRAEAERDLQYETTRDIAEAETFEDGLQAALQDICELTDWEYAEVWLPTDGGELRRTDIDYYEDQLAEFAALSKGDTFDWNEGLPGRVWAAREFEWTANLPTGSLERYPRRERALGVNLKSALGVPVVADDEVVAVLTFLMSEARDTDDRLVEVVSSVAADLGSLVVRRQAEQEMERERDLIDQILAASPIGIQVLNRNGDVTRMNDRAREMLDVPDDRAESYSPADRTAYDADGERVPPDDHPFSRALATGETVFDWETRVELPDGGHRWLTVNAAPVLDADGEVERVVTTGEDITQFKEQTRRLERQRDELKSELDEMFERISDGFYALDEEFRTTYVNDHAKALLGLEESSMIGQDIRETVGLTDQFEAALHEAFEKQSPIRVEDSVERLDAWFEHTIYPSESGLSVHFRDITRRKEHEYELDRTLDLLHAAERTANVGGWEIDLDTREVFWTDHLFDILEIPGDEEPPLDRALDVYHEDDRQIVEDAIEEALDTGDPFDVEVRFCTPSGDVRWLRVQGVPETADGEVGSLRGAAQDITERKERERELKDRIRQQEVVTDLGTQALKDLDLDALMAEAARHVAETLDNDYCKVLDLDTDAEELLLQQGVGWNEGIVGEAAVSAVEDDSQAAYTLATEQPVIVEDLRTESRFSGPDLLRSHDVRSGISTIIGPADDPWGILGTHDTDPKEFSERDATFVQSVANVLAAAIDRHHHEQELVHQREQMEALNSLNEVVREIASAVIEQSTREEIEAVVCERLTESDSYLFAWTGDVDAASQTVNLRTEAGVEEYLDGITISVDPSDERSQGPTGRAFRTGEMQVTHDIRADSRHDPWRGYIEQYGFRSSAAIPIVHEETVFGVLNVYAARASAFVGQEREVFAQLGEVIGHAVAATERKQALLSDDLIELDFQIQNVFDDLDASVELNGTLTMDHMVAVGDGEFLVYGTATPDALDAMSSLVETHPHWESVTVRSKGTPSRFELRVTDPPVLSVITSRGGYLDRIVIEDGNLRMRIHLAPNVDIRQVMNTVEETHPKAEMVRRRQISRDRDDLYRFQRRLVADLTDRQRTALEAAYHAGFFEWPRDTSGEGVAESLGVAPPTFHQHLRKAERKVFDAMFSSPIESDG